MSATLSVVICTHNRCKLLQPCLESVVSQECDPWTFEVIVVDNASTDATKNVALDFSRQTGRVRYVYEVQKGLSRARATGLRQATGRYIAYLDDDAVAHPGWCEAICQTFEQLSAARFSEVVALGGPVEPVFESGRPSWLTAELEPLYTVLDLGKALRIFPPRCLPLGANMSFRREILRVHPWDENLVTCEEAELFDRLTAKGFTCVYVPTMRVSHFVPSWRCTIQWLLARHHSEGLHQRYIRHGFWPKARLMLRAGLGLLRSSAYLLFGAEQQRLFHRCKLRLQIGIFEGFLSFRNVPTVYAGRFNPPESG